MKLLRFNQLGIVRGKSYLLYELPFSVGSDSGDSLMINRPGVAGKHCQIDSGPEGPILIDGSSDQGTCLNGARIERSRLTCGDRIRLGTVELIYEESIVLDLSRTDLPADHTLRMHEVGESSVLTTHRFNNLIQGINGGAHLIELGLRNENLELVGKGWKTVNRNQVELSTLISSLQKMGKPVRPLFAPTDLVVLTREALTRMEGTFSLAKVKFSFESNQQTLTRSVDAEMLSKVLESLLQIAVEACRHEDNPTLQIRISSDDASAVTIQIDYLGVDICLDPVQSVDPVDPNQRSIGGVEFALGRQMVRAHGGELRLIVLGNRNYAFMLHLPGDSQM